MKKLAVPFEFPFDIAKAYEDEEKWYIEGFAGSTEIDLIGDIITEEAFKKSENDLKVNSTVLFNHDPEQSIGKIEDVEARKEGLWVKVLISKTVPETWQKIKEGVINKFSIRGKVIDAVKKFVKELKRVANVIKEMYLIEASLVALPANPAAKALRWYVSKSLQEFEEKGGEIPKDFNIVNKEETMTEILDLLEKMSDRMIADEDKAIVETLKAKIKEKYPNTYPKKKSGEAYTQEEIDSLETSVKALKDELEKAKKPKKVEEMNEEEEKGIFALADEIRKKKKEKYPYPYGKKEFSEEDEQDIISLADNIRKQKKEKYPYPYPKKKSGDAYSQEEIDILEKAKLDAEGKIKQLEAEIKSHKADKEVEKRWQEMKDEYDEKDAETVKTILKKSVLSEVLSPDEIEKISKSKKKESRLFVGGEGTDLLKNLTIERKDELMKIGGIKTKIQK